MNQEIYDARLQHFLRKVIFDMPYEMRERRLKSLYLCNRSPIPQSGGTPAAFVLRSDRNGGEAVTFGMNTCKNPWACPHCTAKMMTKYKTKIALALDALYEQKFFGIMITFTLPHLRYMSCNEITDILYNTYREFFRNAWNKKRRCKRSNKLRSSGVANSFIVENGFEWYARCSEYTWGKKNGWHPHFHCIFWLPRANAKKVDWNAWQEKLNAAWLEYGKRHTLKYWKENNLYESDERREMLANTLYMFKKDKVKPALYISRNADGTVQECKSSDYLCGWGADRELTGNIQKKASHSGHLTPYQILEMAADGDAEMKEKYIEFMLSVTRKPVHHRVDLKSGLIKIIKAYRQTEGYKEIVKKKREGVASWELFAWFSERQWLDLCSADKFSPVISNILYLAAINRKDLLREYLKVFNIELIERPHVFGQHVENIFNGACETIAG